MRGEYALIDRDCPVNARFTPTCVGNTLHEHVSDQRHDRFTPTCVGNTDRASGSISDMPVHPHMRGEYVLAMAIALR